MSPAFKFRDATRYLHPNVISWLLREFQNVKCAVFQRFPTVNETNCNFMFIYFRLFIFSNDLLNNSNCSRRIRFGNPITTFNKITSVGCRTLINPELFIIEIKMKIAAIISRWLKWVSAEVVTLRLPNPIRYVNPLADVYFHLIDSNYSQRHPVTFKFHKIVINLQIRFGVMVAEPDSKSIDNLLIRTLLNKKNYSTHNTLISIHVNKKI